MSYAMAGIEELLGVHGHGFWMNLIQIFNQKVMRPCLERNPDLYMDDSLFREERDFEYKHSISRRYSIPRNNETPHKNEQAKRPSSGEIPLLNRTLSSDSCDIPTHAEIDATDFTYLRTYVPHATRVRPRRKYSDAHVGLDDEQFQWKNVRRHRRHAITSIANRPRLFHNQERSHKHHRLHLIQEEGSTNENHSSGDHQHTDIVDVPNKTAASAEHIEIEIGPKQDIDNDNESSATILFSRCCSVSSSSSKTGVLPEPELVTAVNSPELPSDSSTDTDGDSNTAANVNSATGSYASPQTSGGSIVSRQSVIAEFDGTKDFACSLPWE